jgi:hypothetical protein
MKGAFCLAANLVFSGLLVVLVLMRFCWSCPLYYEGRRYVISRSINEVAFAANAVRKARASETNAVDMSNIPYGQVAPGKVRYLVQSLR